MTISADGTVNFDLAPGREYTVFYGGTFGSGTLSFNLKSAVGGTAVAMPDYPTATAAGAFAFVAPCNVLSVTLADATDPAIEVIVQLCVA